MSFVQDEPLRRTSYTNASILRAAAHVTSEEAEQACILWLPPYQDVVRTWEGRNGYTDWPVTTIDKRQEPHRGMYNHPILVVSRPADEPYIIHFHHITSLRSRTVYEKWPRDDQDWHRASCHPIFPTVTNNGYEPLRLAHGALMAKAGYVDVRMVYRMDWRDAQLYWGKDPTVRKSWKLSAASVKRLLPISQKLAGHKIGLQHATASTRLPSSPPGTLVPLSSGQAAVASAVAKDIANNLPGASVTITTPLLLPGPRSTLSPLEPPDAAPSRVQNDRLSYFQATWRWLSGFLGVCGTTR